MRRAASLCARGESVSAQLVSECRIVDVHVLCRHDRTVDGQVIGKLSLNIVGIADAETIAKLGELLTEIMPLVRIFLFNFMNAIPRRIQ